MQKYLTTIIFLSLSLLTFGQKQVLIALSLNDCSNCYNNINQLKNLDEDVSIKFLLRDKYITDSTEIRNIYAQKLPQMSFVFNDNMYEQMIGPMGQSQLHLINGRDVLGSYSLKTEVNSSLVQLYNNLNAHSDTINYGYNFKGFSVNYIQLVDNKILVTKEKENKIGIIDRFNPLLQHEIEITDSLVLLGYQKYYNDIPKARKSLQFFKNLDYIQIGTVHSAELLDGVVYVGVSIKDLIITDDLNDTFEVGFQCIYTFDTYGEFINCAVLNDALPQNTMAYKRPFFKGFVDTFMYASVVSDIIPQKGSLLVKCMKLDPQKKMPHHYFMAKFILDARGDYQFHEYLPFEAPDFYKKKPFNRFTVYSSNDHNYFTLQMSPELYSLDQMQMINTQMPIDNSHLIDIFSANDVIFDLKVKNGVAYYIVFHDKSDEMHYIALDIQSNKIIKNVLLPKVDSKDHSQLVRIDPHDEKYIWQLADNKIFIRSLIQ